MPAARPDAGAMREEARVQAVEAALRDDGVTHIWDGKSGSERTICGQHFDVWYGEHSRSVRIWLMRGALELCRECVKLRVAGEPPGHVHYAGGIE